jgi:UDP-hydrolysing UDP-N-acetyl-D-glucosamine 2-epimerase
MRKKILFFSGSRADYSLLYPLISHFENNKKYTSKLFLSGHHFSKKYGVTYEDIKGKIKNIYKSKTRLKNTNNRNIIELILETAKELKNFLFKFKPDLLVILGDRYELLSVTIPSFFLKIPILHLHGGEKTAGAYDDVIRHVVSKFSNFHIVSDNVYKKRLIQLGENPKTIFNIGSIGSELALKSKKISFEDLRKKYHINYEKYFLITYHPETNNLQRSFTGLKNLLKVLESLDEVNCIFTYNNTDTDGDIFLKEIKKFCKKNSNARIYKNIGSSNYHNLARYSRSVIGNSSSGVIEVPVLGVNTINIGKRQEGRIMTPSIINTNENFEDILYAVKKVLKKKILYKNRIIKKNIIKNIIKRIKYILQIKKMRIKNFYDIKFK